MPSSGVTLGSPPRMRGKGGQTMAKRTGVGITPACAGKSTAAMAASRASRDHPRVCGEKSALHMRAMVSAGSPPRVRGKVADCGNYTALIGITPAYAGKRSRPWGCRKPLQDHPRVCGEKVRIRRHKVVCGGSPPRMRGKDLAEVAGLDHDGITPAYAGKSGSSWVCLIMARDHPRVCGEKCR